MAKWDLFVDESGSFDQIRHGRGRDSKEHNLVGGFILPHGVYSKELASQWAREIKNTIIQTYGLRLLKEFNQFNPWTTRNSDGKYISHSEFDFTHACNNHFVEASNMPDNRRSSANEHNDTLREIQLRILNEYTTRIIAMKGRIVIFDDPTGTDFGGNTATYLTIIGKGITILYNRIQTLYDDPEPELFCHIAYRTNEEREANRQRAETKVLTLQHDDTTRINRIEKEQYQKTLRNMAFAIASNSLLASDVFTRMFEDEDYIRLIEDGQCARMIPCDFICNSYYRSYGRDFWMNTDEYRSIYANSETAIIIEVINVNRIIDDEFITMMGSRSYLGMFLRIREDGFQKQNVLRFIDCLNKADLIDQKAFIAALADYYFRPTKQASTNGTFAQYVNELELLLKLIQETDSSTRIISNRIKDPSIDASLRANILLYLNALYTHMGNGEEVKKSGNDFQAAIRLMPTGQERTSLQVKYLNRQIVSLTDWFMFDKAEQTFERLNTYWELSLESHDFLEIDSVNTNATSEEYGREIGSYLQLVQHRLRNDMFKCKESYYAHAKPLFSIALKQFSDASDLCRCYMNICGVEREMKNYYSSFLALYNAAQAQEEINNGYADSIDIDSDSCSYIIEVSKCIGRTQDIDNANPWILYHYIRLIQDMCIDEPSKALILFEELNRIPLRKDSFEWINFVFLKSIIQWHAARILSQLEKSTDVSDYYFQSAASTMCGSISSTYNAIGIAIYLEWISVLIDQERLNEVVVLSKKLKKSYAIFLQHTRISDAVNIFDADGTQDIPRIVENLMSILKEELNSSTRVEIATIGKQLHSLSLRIAY